MRLLTICILVLLLQLSSSLQARTLSNEAILKTSIVKPSKLITDKAITTSSSNCTSATLAALSGEAFVNYIIDNETSCLSFLFESTDAATLYSQTNFMSVANAATEKAATYDGSQSLSNLFYYLRAGYYLEFYSPDLVSINEAMLASVKEALVAFEKVNGFSTIATSNHGKLLTEWVNTADGASLWVEHHTTVKALLADVTEFKATDYNNTLVYNSIMFYLFRGQNNGRLTYGENVINHDDEIANMLADFITNEHILASIEYIADNATLELGRLLQWPDIYDSVKPAIQQVLDANVRLSSRWMSLVTAINQYVDCTDFTGDVCANDALRQEITTLAFPNKFEFDGGAMKFHTPLSREEIEQIYYQLKEVEATFFKVTGATEPITGDVNDVAIFRIYGSQQQYSQYQTFLYNLPSNNGGIYIERDSTLYTWDREPWENTFSLEELARHEYVHYLVSRYLIQGYWGETQMYDDNRVTWLDEGLANFLAGGTQSNGITPLKTMVDWIANRDTHYTPEQASTVGYNDQLMYPYSALLFNYLYENKSTAFKELTEALRNDDVVTYDAIRAEIGTLSADDFSTYINTWVTKSDSIEAPWKNYLTEAQLEFSHAVEISDAIENEFSLPDVNCSDISAIQFGCNFTLNYTVENDDTPLFELYSQIDLQNESFINSSLSNVQTLNCYPTLIGSTSHTIHCEGGLRRPEVEWTDENDAPISTDSSLSVTSGSSVNGTMNSTDANGDTLTWNATEPSSGSLTYDINTDSFTYTSDSTFTGTATFTFTTNDGQVDSNTATVTITVNAATTNNNTSTSSESGGGGSIGFSFLLFGGIVLFRQLKIAKSENQYDKT